MMCCFSECVSRLKLKDDFEYTIVNYIHLCVWGGMLYVCFHLLILCELYVPDLASFISYCTNTIKV